MVCSLCCKLLKPTFWLIMIPASFTQYDADVLVFQQTSYNLYKYKLSEYSNQPDDFCATIRCQFHRTLFSPCPTCQKCDQKWFIIFYNFFPSKILRFFFIVFFTIWHFYIMFYNLQNLVLTVPPCQRSDHRWFIMFYSFCYNFTISHNFFFTILQFFYNVLQFHRTCPECQKSDHQWFIMGYNFTIFLLSFLQFDNF